MDGFQVIFTCDGTGPVVRSEINLLKLLTVEVIETSNVYIWLWHFLLVLLLQTENKYGRVLLVLDLVLIHKKKFHLNIYFNTVKPVLTATSE